VRSRLNRAYTKYQAEVPTASERAALDGQDEKSAEERRHA